MLFVCIGSVFLILLLLLLRRAPIVEGSSETLVQACDALKSLRAELLAAGFLERIFSQQDLNYITSSTPVAVQKIFVNERRQIARSWIAGIRRCVGTLMLFHISQSRHYARLKLSTEIALAANFGALSLACWFLELALYWAGPFPVLRIFERASLAASRICTASEKSLSFINEASVQLARQAAD
jgi:hypothetical protein